MNSKLCFGLLMGIMFFGVMRMDSVVQAANVTITESTFPNTNFRNYILSEIDKDKDGVLSEKEIAKTTKLRPTWEALSRGFENTVNFQGIGFFTNLQDLEIDADSLSEYSELGDEECELALHIQLDLSQNTKLKRFYCRAKSVENLNLADHGQLQEIYLYTVENGSYPMQDLRTCKKLKVVRVGDHVKLPKSLPELTTFEYWGSSKCEMDLSRCKKLKKLVCSKSRLDKPDFSKLRQLVYLDCSGNSWKKLNLNKNSKLKTLYCNNCSLRSLVLPKHTKLSVVSCKNNRLKKLNVKQTKVRMLLTKGNKKIKIYK